MTALEFWLEVLAFAGSIVGGWGICLARTHACRARVKWGQRLFVGTLLGLGGCGLVAASVRAEGLATLGLVAGLLLIAMLWEGFSPEIEKIPFRAREEIQDAMPS